ncbi:MAG: glycosyltransferase, partial [Elusimicrobiota bacterium]
GEERSALESLVKALGLEGDVALPGFARNPYALMRKASCLVLSSTFEGFGNVLVEALAMGCPVVSTDCPCGPTEILAGGEWGRLVPIGDPEALAAAVLPLLDGKAERDPEHLRAYLRRFSLAEVTSQYLDVFFPPDAE